MATTNKDTRLLSVPELRPKPEVGVVRLDWVDSRGPQSVVVNRRSIVGSSDHVDVRVEDDTVSRLHVELSPDIGGFWVRDLESKNGTWLQGVRIERERIEGFARLRIGSVKVAVVPVVAEPPRERSVASASDGFGDLRGASAPMQALYGMLSLVAASDSPALVCGETGTGKELVARAIHRASSRASGPFVVVDCGALPESLLDAELFGHARGAFTGATGERAGSIESAHGGTVFIDEIGELPIDLQPKLLRVLEAKTVRRLGENRHRAVDVRFIFATHRDLAQRVADGLFREDLFFRINVLYVDVPPLRERLDDLGTLIQHFLGPDHPPLDDALLTELRQRRWSGNVRELRNFVARLRAVGLDGAMKMENRERRAVSAETQVPRPHIENAEPLRAFRQRWLAQGEAEYVSQLLERHDNNVTAAARTAGVDRTHFHRMMRKYGIDRGA